MKKYFMLGKDKATKSATLNIFGEITSVPEIESDVSSHNLSTQLAQLTDVDQIDVYINSYGGEVAEGLAIYNALRRHKANITTHCEGFACSIASVIFMAGDKRVMNESSLLMIHNAWDIVAGNAEELRKQADDLEKINQAATEAYKAHSTLKEDEIKALMDDETWILPEEALSYGFATSIDRTEKGKANQNAFLQLFNIIKAHQAAEDDEDETEPDEPENDEPETDEPTDEPPEEENLDDDEEGTDDPDDDEPDEETGDEETAQKWSGFFNAILKKL